MARAPSEIDQEVPPPLPKKLLYFYKEALGR